MFMAAPGLSFCNLFQFFLLKAVIPFQGIERLCRSSADRYNTRSATESEVRLKSVRVSLKSVRVSTYFRIFFGELGVNQSYISVTALLLMF
jgi:hypothetical protein